MKTTTATTTVASNHKTATSSYYHSTLTTLFIHHRQCAYLSLKRMCQHPLASLLTLLVLAVSLALPALLTVLLSNATTMSHNWNSSARISVYLSVNSNQQRAEQIVTLLKERYQLQAIRYISPSEGLAQFEHDTGIEHVLAQLQRNPLPGVIEITPATTVTAKQLETLSEQVQQFPGVDSVQLDLAWVKRLHNIIIFAKRVISVLAILLASAVLLVVGNTIRLATQNRQQEIMVMKLIGATNAFIRRPFLYTGIFYGTFGALMAWVMVTVVIMWLRQPVARLATSYHSDFHLHGLLLTGGLQLVLIGAALGLNGAALAVNLHLRQLD